METIHIYLCPNSFSFVMCLLCSIFTWGQLLGPNAMIEQHWQLCVTSAGSARCDPNLTFLGAIVLAKIRSTI
ncbi:hypothetical protein B0J11DRAFT_257614 [Dendryphion nanum]|uniref:Uncharacterized protein n=1 Tax=Dendryphion nanum TaxID=256645 RepID=A0A9P9E4S0_9PLEO|nr:hypothetical protein B0J11DRAFT_257614 [Dendryphion nanum]